MIISDAQVSSNSPDAVTIFRAATLAQTHVSNIYKQRSKLRAFKREDGTWMIPADALRQYIDTRRNRAREVLAETTPDAGRRVFKRRMLPVALGEFLSQTCFPVKVESYSPFESAEGSAIAELELSLEVSYNLDPDDDRSMTFQVKGCMLHQCHGKFWITLPIEFLTLRDPEDYYCLELSVFKDLVKAFPEVIPAALVQVTDELLRKEQEELSV